MARVHPPHPISGTIGDITYVRRGKKTYARGKIWAHNKAAEPRQRENRQSFGGASKVACEVYTPLTAGCKQLFRSYCHNDIATKLRAHAERTERSVTHYSFRAAHAALANLDLSPAESPSACLNITRIGCHHNPEAIRLTGLPEAARFVANSDEGLLGNAHLQMRLWIRQVPFHEFTFDKTDKVWRRTFPEAQGQGQVTRSGWIPTDILPEEGLTLTLNKHPETLPGQPVPPMLTFVVIEWREVRAVGDKVFKKPALSIVKLAAMHYSTEMAAEIAQFEARISQKPKQPRAFDLLQAAQSDPKAFLTQSLAGLMAPPPA